MSNLKRNIMYISDSYKIEIQVGYYVFFLYNTYSILNKIIEGENCSGGAWSHRPGAGICVCIVSVPIG